MSDKADGITDKNLSVASTLDDAIRMFDAVPMSNDLAPEFWQPRYAARAVLFHYALELGMKCMSPGYRNTHQLVKIYRGLRGSDKKMLNEAFMDAVSFYGLQVDCDEWMHMSKFDTYLDKTGDDILFQKIRYSPLEGVSDLFEKPLPDLLINREMVRFIHDVLTGYDNHDGGPFFVSQLVDAEVHRAFLRKVAKDNSNPQLSKEDSEAYKKNHQIFRQWVTRHDSLLLAIKDAYEHDFDVLNDWGNTVLKGVYDSLKETDDYRIKFALAYKLSTFGAKSSDCDYETISSAKVRQVGRRGTVGTPSGHPLGNITERHDGLCTAEYARAKRQVRDPRTIWWELAVDRNNAIGLLIENATVKVSVALNGGTPREARIIFLNNPNSRQFFDGDDVCEFLGANHGIKAGDEISILGIGQVKALSNPETHGIVKSVDNHKVTISKTR